MLLCLLLAVLGGCASLPANYPRASSQALLHPEETRPGKNIETRVRERPGTSGFSLLPRGYDASLARVRLLDQAKRTLDLQYYISHADLTGKFLLDPILAAA
jgi:putative cardiolipin synthase